MKKQIISVIAIHVIIIAAAFTASALTGPSQPVNEDQPSSAATAENDQKTPEIKPAPEKQPAERPQEAVQNVDTHVQPSQTPAAPAAPQSEPEPAKIEAGGHIPFTNKPVTAGDPESYVDTVGQCPFYEMAGPKGCVPPPDIECNADWSVCKLKEGN